MTELKTILMIADENLYGAYCESPQVSPYYDFLRIHGEWDCKDKIAVGTSGPLNAGFVKALVEKFPNKYDGVIINEICRDLIAPLKEGGYKGPIIGITLDDELEGANESVTLSGPFHKNLKETLDRVMYEK